MRLLTCLKCFSGSPWSHENFIMMHQVFYDQSLLLTRIPSFLHRLTRVIFLAPKYNVKLWLKFAQYLSTPIEKNI